jgi:TolA-binding protein
MKRSERHHLKENEVALSVARAREQFEAHRQKIIGGAIVVVVLLAALGGYFWWRQRVDTESRAMLADAMAIDQAQVVPPPAPPAPGQPANAANTVPPPGTYPSEQAKLQAALPKFMAAADAYPNSQAGIAARYYAAACLVALGRPKEAIERYREVVDRADDSLYGDMARLGLAEAEVEAGQYDAAIKEYRELVTKPSVPTDAVLMQLGRAYERSGKRTEAKQAFQRILDEFPQSQYTQVAKRELEAVKAG